MASPIIKKDVERRFYMTHTTGVTAQTPYGELKRRYYIQYLAGTQPVRANTSLGDLKRLWMRKWLLDHGGVAPTESFDSDLWKAMAASIGQRPVKSTSTNIMNFYLNAP